MTDPTALAPQGLGGWAQLVLGSLLLAAPGVAAVDRFLGLTWRNLALAPVFALTLLPLTAILLDLLLQAPVTPPLTALEALAWVAILEWPRRRQALAWLRAPRRPAWWRPVRLQRGAAAKVAAVALAFGGVWLVHSLPHLPGDEAGEDPGPPGLERELRNAAKAPAVLGRIGVGLSGEEYPYPIHVDEHYHLSRQAAVERQGRVAILDPYTGQPQAAPLFSIQGFRDERGFDVAMVQAHQLNGLSLYAQARLAPAVEAVVLAAVLYAALWPAPGALASAALVTLIPTSVRFLGPGFLVPSAFALPWVVAALHVSLRGSGGRRLAALALLETAGFFLHLVVGTLVLATAAVASLARPGRLVDRVTLAAVCFLPLLWIGPLVTGEVALAVGLENELPFQPAVLYSGALAAIVAALVGAGLAAVRPDPALSPHRVLLALGAGVAASLLLSVRTGHHSDATYSRLIPTYFVCIAALAGLAIGVAADAASRRWLGSPRLRPRRDAWRPLVAPGLCAAFALVVAAPAIGGHLSEPYYRVMDDPSWADARILVEAGATEGDVLLSHPWRAPVYNALTGAHVHAFLMPGNPPAGQADWDRYLRSGGANETWLRERSIDYVIAPVAPRAEHLHLGGNVYRIAAPEPAAGPEGEA
jgi:hypothetical protein